jgi:hypothetical protein
MGAHSSNAMFAFIFNFCTFSHKMNSCACFPKAHDGVPKLEIFKLVVH